ncbi:MAG: hypothetical protein WCG48_01665 [Candidatus Berkelbacteria bacterium]
MIKPEITRKFKTNLRVSTQGKIANPKGALLPIRINLIGGWTDQLFWEGPAAVINIAAGWGGCYDGGYPFMLLAQGENYRVSSRIPGIGTGLGISSILEGGKYLLAKPDGDFVGHTLEWEWNEGTKGGWQDQVGAIIPGLKLIKTTDHENFSIKQRDDHPVMSRIVLFDTDIRRRSGNVGDIVRLLIKYEPKFSKYLSTVVDRADSALLGDADEMIDLCLESWVKLSELIKPYFEMDVDVPTPDRAVGHMLCGAGGGGYGIMFAKSEDDRDQVISDLEKQGFWATKPTLLDGIKFF